MTSPGDSNSDERAKILDAAVRCFERYGPQRTSMTDIADEAGISRRTLYRQFNERPALIAEILDQRIFELRKAVVKRLERFDDLEEALVEGSLFSVEAAEADELMSEIVAHEHAGTPGRFLLRTNEATTARMVESWGPLIERARDAGRVRDGLSNERAVELIITVHAVALLRDDLGQTGRRALFRDLLVAAVLKP
ncbi:TetR/AcrR family transcriptional regulator [Ilumatobacter coccineus]|uniref:Putative TetR family transcriptional regulator n=1 Tax=Ilumatobacter coccineus (strain NBRC 103263 / KCTC 29153 / YM16-304) TaxID=1313172 RepID=A0A6C7DW68_ILUCY|nr:TetR/AcrR family transcriptional regulator [Ilumatobacter coccineus]BAN00864.1 putative TetR family transcriptional regulator [Ilumatobacter coccineus YM16-304]